MLCVVFQDPGQQSRQQLAFGGGQGGEQLVLDAGQHSVEQAELLGSGRGDGDDVAAAVGRIGGASDQPASGEVVERCHHVAAVDAGAAAQCRLAGWPELFQGGEQAVVVADEAGGGERLRQQPV